MVRITIENATKMFGSAIAVDNINLEIRDKELFILLGPSGSGKSTILNCIAGLEHLDQGQIHFDDESIEHLPPEKRDVAMVFQSYALYPHMNVYDNISFALKIRKISRETIEKRVLESTKVLGISHLLRRKPHELSGGERQRVALARAMVRNPKVFLMDEPMSNLDAKLRVSMRAELIRLQKKLETTTVYVTHDQVEAMTMGERIAVLDKGRLQQCADPIHIYRHPDNLFVAGFIGSPPMNFFECTFDRRNGVLDTSEFRLNLPPDLIELLMTKAENLELVLGIRPQDARVCESQETPDCVGAEVYAVEPLGSETLVDLKIGDRIVRVVSSTEYQGRIGNKTWMKIDPRRIYLFDRKTEQKIV